MTQDWHADVISLDEAPCGLDGASGLLVSLPVAVEADKTRPHPIERLPFVKSREGGVGRDFWNVPSTTGDFSVDCELGSALALRALEYISRDTGSSILGWIIQGMIQRGRFSGIEIGFMHAIAIAARKGFIQQPIH